MSTDTRTVAEILGWTNSDGKDSYYLECYRRPDGSLVDVSSGPTVDDMLAWLKRAFDVTIRTSQNAPFTDVILTSRRTEIGIWFGDTLHAALETAIRAVVEDGQ